MSDNVRMRIALLSHQWPGARMGGIGSCVRQTAIALARAGHDVHVFTLTLPADVRAALPPDVCIHETPDIAESVATNVIPAPLAAAIGAGGEGIYRLAIGWRLAGALLEVHSQRPFDVVEAPEVEALGLPLRLQPEFDVPVVTHLHCCTAIAREANGGPLDEEGRLTAALEFAAIHLADAVCAPTEAVAVLTRELVPTMPSPRIIPHPFAGASSSFNAPPPTGPVLFVGRLERLKGVESLIEALNQFLPPRPEAMFRFIGPDTNTAGGRSMRQFLQSRLDPSIRNRVEFCGELSPAEISASWARASFGVMPSLRDNFSMACCEAMAAGRTIVVALGTGSVELIGDAGIVADRGSVASLSRAMADLWDDRDRLLRLSQAAFERIRTFCSPDRVAAQRISFYEDCLRPSAHERRAARSQQLAALPPACSSAILPALSRITGILAGVRQPLVHTPGTRLLHIMNGLERRHRQPAKVLLYGAGKHTARLLSERQVWESRGHRIVGIIDDHPRFQQSPVYLDLPVQSVGAAKARVLDGHDLPPVVLSTDTYEDQFWDQSAPLREAGVPVFRLYT